MGTKLMSKYLNRKMISNFISSSRGMVEGKAQCIRCINKKFRETWPHHRSLRIMAKHGYLEAKKGGSYTDYYITPKGLALYDCVVIYLKPS